MRPLFGSISDLFDEPAPVEKVKETIIPTSAVMLVPPVKNITDDTDPTSILIEVTPVEKPKTPAPIGETILERFLSGTIPTFEPLFVCANCRKAFTSEKEVMMPNGTSVCGMFCRNQMLTDRKKEVSNNTLSSIFGW